MIPPYIDLVLRVGRLLGTIRSLIVQTEQLLDRIENMTGVAELVDDGLEL